ncbi:AIR1 domain-containing protein [Blumeria hordei DH14]|uniref:AIR1 domain-containing protein n=1 Tax=Blumeria graminis f. sp. hordei (strain DH14) TaxID=546991 RepID=N1JBE3_BLUG1|nr:AIR1 domain-containing protein [Blumeria hordei DH14]
MSQKKSPVEERMMAIEEVVKKSFADPALVSAPAVTSGAPTLRSYASVVAPQMTKTAVRIRIDGAQNLQPDELLSKAKQHIEGAFAIRQMRSHDTEVYVQSASQRDAALKMCQPPEFKIFRQDFPVEVFGVPLRTRIVGGRDADNYAIIREIETATKVRIPGLRINRIRWLHDGKKYQRSKKNRQSRGSIVVSLLSEAMQTKVVRNGLVINAMLFTAQAYSPRAQPKQCFNCSQWGHIQASCGKAARCSEFAGAHQTRDCPRKRVSCANCGKEHRSWQKAACRTYQVYKGSVEKAQMELSSRTADIWNEKPTMAPIQTVGTADDQGFTLVTSKKAEGP